MIVLSLCDRTGNMVAPWVRAGHKAFIVDVQHVGTTTEGNVTRVGADVRRWTPPERPDIVFAFPPCTHLAGSGARWWAAKGLRPLIEGLEIVEACRAICEASGAPWMIENPVGRLATIWRPADYLFDPCEYAGYLPDPDEDAYTKRTCLWIGGGFRIPAPRTVFPIHGSKMHRMWGGEGGADDRSVTPMGFAEAVFQANAVRP